MAEALQRVGRGEILDRAAMSATMDEIMAGACDDRQIAGLLMGMAARGEHLEEIVGAAMAMRRVVHRIVARRQPLLDTCGTGGSGVPRRNVSTAAAIAVAACGVGVAKHGNRGASSPCGSADLLEAVGVDLGLSAEQIGASIDRLGIGFCFAPALHPAMRHAAS